MKSVFQLALLLCLISTVRSQNSIVQKDSINIQNLILKKKQYHQMTNGTYDGYRIKIFSDIDRNKMEKVKNDFQSKYSDIQIYDDYIQPNFILMIGNFRTKLEAHEILKKIQMDYPNAFIIKTKISPNL